MPSIQHRDARKLLKVIRPVWASSKTLTYLEAATLIGRMPPQKHARTTAQVCDLLDAAACLAGVPLLALVAVRDASGGINPKAWKKEYGPLRDTIIERSRNHRFSRSDYDAISGALEDLGDRGNVNAWKYLRGLYPGELLYKRLVGDYAPASSDAINDVGTDTPDYVGSNTWSYARDPGVRAIVLRRAGGKCELCGKSGFIKRDGTFYLESHHVIALANDGADRPTNVIALCPDDHREAHFGRRSEELERQMVATLAIVNR